MRAMTVSVFYSEVRKFIDDETSMLPSKWFNSKFMEVYLRNGLKNVNGQVVRCITVSNVQVYEEYQGTGEYGKFLDIIEQAAGNKPIYIENVHQREQDQIYLTRGYRLIPDQYSHLVSCFVKIPSNT